MLREELIGRVGRGFHVSRLDTTAIARENMIPEYLVCRYLEIYRARRRKETA